MEPGEYAEMRLLRWTGPVEVRRARYTSFEFPTHAHPEFTIGEVLQGTEVFSHSRKEVAAPSGWFFHLNPSAAHNGRAERNSWTYVSLYPSMKFLRNAIPELFAEGDPGFATPVSQRPRLRGRLAHFVGRVFAGGDDLELQSELIAALAELFQEAQPRQPARVSKRSAAVGRIRERLSDDWASDLSLLELADSVSLTPLSLMRAFRETVGCTPQIYRTSRRLEIARSLLAEGATLSGVALGCGFSDQSHFTNTFRRWIGLTPGEYRQIARLSGRRD